MASSTDKFARMQRLFVNIRPGDGIYLSHEGQDYQISVLRVMEGGEILLSKPSRTEWASIPDRASGPYRWSEEKGALVNRNGNIPEWYSLNINFESGVARQALQAYLAIPTAGDAEVVLDDPIRSLMGFSFSDPKARIIDSILANGEAKDFTTPGRPETRGRRIGYARLWCFQASHDFPDVTPWCV